MDYFAHTREDGERQTVKEHLFGTAELAARFATPFHAEEVANLSALLHDIGKYTVDFQRRLLENRKRVDHATAGAFECAKRNQLYAAFVVAGHHGGLPNRGTAGDLSDEGTLIGRLRRGQEGKLADYQDYQKEIVLPSVKLPEFCAQKVETDMFFIRMLYSCLVDADFLDTERFIRGPRDVVAPSMEELRQKVENYTAKWFPPKSDLNKRRCEILQACREKGRDEAPGLFTLTVPTGGGKTVSSLAFALEHAVQHNKHRVIYVIPYTSIIEQTADEFCKILGSENVLEHHSGVQYDEEDCATPEVIRKKNATENWDMPVIVTTAVQFFESLHANRSSKCRKLHNLADSVIIFDETQMIPIPYLRPCVFSIGELVAHYGVSAVLCTATQPALDKVFREYFSHLTATELCPEGVTDDPIFRRTTIERIGIQGWDALADRLNEREQVLCIVNSRKNAQQVFERFEGEGCFHLSTLMTPKHRRAVLKEIRECLKNKRPCRVVSTSLIEAGVDVDFPFVFREEAGLDAMLQAAGRCNREGKNSAEESKVYLFQSEGMLPNMFHLPVDAAKVVLREYEDITTGQAIRRYFEELLELKGKTAQDIHDIMKKMKSQAFPFQDIADEFHLIETETRTIYILREKEQEYLKRLKEGERSRELFRELAQYGVSVYPKHFEELEQAGDIRLLEDDVAVLENWKLYEENTGLSMKADFGKGIFQ